MYIYDCDEKVKNTSIDVSCLDRSGVLYDGKGILLPYKNEKFLIDIRTFVDEVVTNTQPLWKEPDYEKSRAYFYIVDNQVGLVVEALPRYYSAVEKQSMLQMASKKLRADGYSDYYELLDMFDSIDTILNVPKPSGEIDTFRMELSDDEMQRLLTSCK